MGDLSLAWEITVRKAGHSIAFSVRGHETEGSLIPELLKGLAHLEKFELVSVSRQEEFWEQGHRSLRLKMLLKHELNQVDR